MLSGRLTKQQLSARESTPSRVCPTLKVVAGCLISAGALSACSFDSPDNPAPRPSVTGGPVLEVAKPLSEDVETIDSAVALMQVPQTFLEFTEERVFHGIITGTVEHTTVEVENHPVPSVTTLAKVRITKTTGAAGLEKGKAIQVLFFGGTTTKGAVNRMVENKTDEAGKPLLIDPQDKTPIRFSTAGMFPPVTGDQLLLFLGKASYDPNIWVSVSRHRGTYFMAKPRPGETPLAANDVRYTRRGELDVAELSSITVTELNEHLSQGQRPRGNLTLT